MVLKMDLKRLVFIQIQGRRNGQLFVKVMQRKGILMKWPEPRAIFSQRTVAG
jgi:hypothetical protein